MVRICSLFLILCFSSRILAEKPIVTDEFDRILITPANIKGDVLGKIELVTPNALETSWSLVKHKPYGDRRRYLRPGQHDATAVVSIDSKTGEIIFEQQPKVIPGEYYAEVRASNSDGWMEQVLIVIALPVFPPLENALDIFTQRYTNGAIGFYETGGVAAEKVQYASSIASALLAKDRRGDGRVSRYVAEANAVMTLFETFEERNEAIGFYLHERNLQIQTQDLQDEEIIPDFLRLGGPAGMRRDASVEEITHLIHRAGIMRAYPGLQKRLEAATKTAISRGFWTPQDGLPEDSYADEYLIYGLDIYYGVHTSSEFEGVRLTPDNLRTVDEELHDIVSFLFPTREELFRSMGWQS